MSKLCESKSKENQATSLVFRVEVVSFKLPLHSVSGPNAMVLNSESIVSEPLRLSEVGQIKPVHVYTLIQKLKCQDSVNRHDLF